MTARYLVHPDSILEWVTGVQIYPLISTQPPKPPAKEELKLDGKPQESKKEEPSPTADSKPEERDNESKGGKQAKGTPNKKENNKVLDAKTEVAAEPRSKVPRAHSFTLNFEETEYDSSTSDSSDGGRSRMTYIKVEKQAKKKVEFIPGKAPKLKPCLKRTKSGAVEDKGQEDVTQNRCVDSITEANTRANRGLSSDGHISKAKVNFGDCHSPSISSSNHPDRPSQAWHSPKNISASQPQPQNPSQDQSNCICSYSQQQRLRHPPSQTQSPLISGQNPPPNQHQRDPSPVIQQQPQRNNALNSPNCGRPRTQAVQQPPFQRPSIMQTPQAQIIQPIRAEVIMREDVIESPIDPRPNAFFCAKTGVLRVYHGAQYGNPYATILPHPPVPIGTYPPHIGQFMGHPGAVPGTVPALVPGGPPSMHAPLPNPAAEYHSAQQVNTPAMRNRNFSGGSSFQYGGPQEASLGPPPLQSPNNNGWHTLTPEQTENIATGNMPGSFPMDAPAKEQQSSFNNDSGSGWNGTSSQQNPGHDPISPALGLAWQNFNQNQQQNTVWGSNNGVDTPAWQSNGGSQQQNNGGNVPGWQNNGGHSQQINSSAPTNGGNAPGWQNNNGGNQNSVHNTPVQYSSAPNNQCSNDNSNNWNGGNQNPNNSSNNKPGGSEWNDCSYKNNSGGRGFSSSSNNNNCTMNSGGDWNNSNSNHQPPNDTYNNHFGRDPSWGNNGSSNNNSGGGNCNNNDSSNNNNNNSGGESWNNNSADKASGGDSFFNNDSSNNNPGGRDWNNTSSNNDNNNSGGFSWGGDANHQSSNDKPTGGSWGGDNSQPNSNNNSYGGNNFDPQYSNNNSGGSGWNSNNSNQHRNLNDNSGSGGWNNNTFNNTNDDSGANSWNGNNNNQTSNGQVNNASNNPGSGNDWGAPANPAPWGDMSAAQSGGPPNSPQSNNNNNNFNNSSGGSGWNNNTTGPSFQNNNNNSGGVGGGGGNNWGNETILSAGSWGGDATGPTGSGGGASGKQNGW